MIDSKKSIIIVLIFSLFFTTGVYAQTAPEAAKDPNAVAGKKAEGPADRVIVGAFFGLNPNQTDLDLPFDNPYLSGEASRLVSTKAYGGKLILPFDRFGIGLQFWKYSTPEAIDTSSDETKAAKATTWTMEGMVLPVQVLLFPVNNERGMVYMGWGIAAHTMEFSATAPGDVSNSVKSWSVNHDFLLGADVRIISLVSVSMELHILRGGQNDAEYTQTGSKMNKIAVSQNSEFMQIGVNLHF